MDTDMEPHKTTLLILKTNTYKLFSMKKLFTLLGLTIAFTVNAQTNTNNGTESLEPDPTGTNNSAFGYQSLKSNDSGTNNSAFGYQSLKSNISGKKITAFGAQSLLNNTAIQLFFKSELRGRALN